ncbi:MAG: molybdenum cofactor guanylyltransferase [Planctomycetaceae bacterium]
MAPTRTRFGGIVLCGGRSTRMGRPKLSLPFGSETMLERVVRILSEVVEPIVVVAAPEQELPPLPGSVRIARDEEEGLGPLSGLAAGFGALAGSVDAVYVSSCDVPLLSPAFVTGMIERLGTHDLAIPREGNYHHPLAAVYRCSLEPKVRSLLVEGRLRPFFLMEDCDAHVVDVSELRAVDPELESLRNCNTEEDYQRALRDAGL